MTKSIAQLEVVTSQFDRVARSYASWYQGGSPRAHSFRIRQQRVYQLFSSPGGQVLDIGCGPAIMVDWLLAQGCNFYGVDIAEEMIDECRRIYQGKTKAIFSVGKIEQLDFQDGFFDSVVCMGVLEYLDDDERALVELARVTKPGGEVIVTLPSAVSPWRLWEERVYNPATRPLRALIRRNHKYEITHRSYREGPLSSLLSAHSLVPNEIVYYDFQLFPTPLDRLLPQAAVGMASRLEGLSRTWLRRLATGFIVRAVKE